MYSLRVHLTPQGGNPLSCPQSRRYPLNLESFGALKPTNVRRFPYPKRLFSQFSPETSGLKQTAGLCHFLPWGQHPCVVAAASQAPRAFPAGPTPQCLWGWNCSAGQGPTPSCSISALTEIPCATVQQHNRAQAWIFSWNTNSEWLWRSAFHSILGCEQGRLRSQSLLVLPGCGDSTGWGMRDSALPAGVHSQLFHMGSVNDCITQDFLMENKSLLFDGQIFVLMDEAYFPAYHLLLETQMLERTGIFLWKRERITSLSQLSGRRWNINSPAQGTLDQINLFFKQLEDL